VPTDTAGHPRFWPLAAIFTLSGFAGLIYQSIWSHYLGLTLGHAAYAQTLVLAIYMAGLALGSWLASRGVLRIDNALRAYALVELLVGLFGLTFHPGFVAYTSFSQDSVLPTLPTNLVHAYQWGTAALLILPQCVLLGATFPLMASACLRIGPAAQGRALGGLYFSNSFGAALGALLATFVLLPSIGMPGAMQVAAVLNLAVAACAWWLSRAPASAEQATIPALASPAGVPGSRLLAIVLVAAAITGATSFVYEVVWVRMLNLALGTTMHSFELMLAAFILGLAAGGWWIHRRGDKIGNALWLAGFSQVAMGLCALLSALAFGQSFRVVAWLVRHLPPTEAGYAWFNAGSAGIALLVMFPAAFFAGSTLPLFTLALLRAGQGERAIGRVYAANTLGAIVGVLAAVHVLVPVVGLHSALLLAAAFDIALGVLLLDWFGAARARKDTRFALSAGVAMVAVALLFGRPDPLATSSGVYRAGRLMQPEHMRMRFLADGKTATVSVFESVDGSAITIATNGKPEAGMAPLLDQPAFGDEETMLLIAALPLALHAQPREVGVIGWGSGLTAHTLLGSPRVQRLETVEIEPAMVRGAQEFGERVARAYVDPRATIVYEDARTYFAAGRKRYDVIVSEPSNPWVSGVSSLFTGEFYGFAARHLQSRGLFVQWLQEYEISDALQARAVGALLSRFKYVDAYLAGSSDLVYVASQEPLPALDWRRVADPPLGPELRRVALVDSNALALRRLGGRAVLSAYVRANEGDRGFSDFYPQLALEAPRDRFTHAFAGQLRRLALNGLPVLDVVDGRRVPRLAQLYQWDRESSMVRYQFYAGSVASILRDADPGAAAAHLRAADAEAAARLLALSRAPVAAADLAGWSAALAVLGRYGPGALASEDLHGSWIDPAWLAPGQPAEVHAIMAAYEAAARRDAAAMHANASRVLALPVELAVGMREQMLLIAMLGAAGQRDFAQVLALDARYGGALPREDELGRVRRFLVAWASAGGR
jgi:predicted membrane-bound spermidine synthase